MSHVATHRTVRPHIHWTSRSHWSTRSHRSTRTHWAIVATHVSSRSHSHRSSWSHWTSRPHARSHHSIRHHVTVHHWSIWSTRAHIHRAVGPHRSSRSHHGSSPGVHHSSSHRPHPTRPVIEGIVSEDRVSHHVHVPGQGLVHRDGRVLAGPPLLLGVASLVAASSASYWALEPSRHFSLGLL